MAYGVFNPGYGAQPQLLAPAPYGAVQPILMHPSQASAAETVKWAAFHRGEATTDTEVNSSISDRSSSLSSGGKRVGAPLFGGALDAAVPSFKDAARRVRLGRGLAPERSTFSALGLDTVRKPREAPACRRGPAVDTKEWLSTEVAARRAAAVPAGGKPGHKSHACGSSDRTSAPNSDAEVSDCSPSSFVSPTATDAESISNKLVQPLGLGPSARPAAMQPDETTASMAAARGFLLGYRSLARPDTSLKLRAVLVPHSPEIQPSNLWHGLSSPAAKSLSRQEMLNSPLGRQSSQTLPTPTGKAYRVRAYSSDHIGNFGRNVRSLLNKVCPENVASVAEKVSQVKIQTAEELQLMIQLLFKKALAEPHYCETYADLVFALKSAFQEFPSPEGGKPVTFRSSLLNTVQGEFEDLQAAGTSAEASVDRQELEQARKSRALANMKFIGHLFLRHLLPVRVVSSLARALLLCDEAASMPSDVAVECACELLMAVGYTMEASALPIARQALAEACARLSSLKREGGYCKRIQFVIQDVLDTRGAGWTRKLFKSSAKTMEEVRLDQQRDLSSQGASSSGVERVVAGQRPNYLAACT